VRQPDLQQRLAALGFDAVTGMQSQADATFRADIAAWGKMVKALGLKVE
jgi:hypothetical protein